jgi:hypothetical protein
MPCRCFDVSETPDVSILMAGPWKSTRPHGTTTQKTVIITIFANKLYPKIIQSCPDDQSVLEWKRTHVNHTRKGTFQVPWNRKIPLKYQNRIGIQYFHKHQKVRSRQTPLPNGNNKVKSTADDELVPAAELELLEYIFREMFFFFLLSHVATAVSAAVTTASLRKVTYIFVMF